MNPDQKTKPDRILHVGSPNIGDRALFDKLVDEIFERKWFTNMGTVEKQFEQKLCDYLGVKHCIPVCNATVGLQLACHALELTGEVIVPAFTFVATPHAVHWERLTPVFADVIPDTHCICPASVESLITDKTSAILGVHLWGNPCDTDKLQQIAEQNKVEVMYDAAHAFGGQHNGQMIGSFGRCEVFSFHATKFFNTFEGGAIATNDDELAAKVRLMKNFGFAGMDNVVHLGTNAKMTEICAAMGISVMAKLDDILALNKHNYDLYRQKLSDLPGIRVVNYDHLEKTNWQYIVVEIDDEKAGTSRDQLFEFLLTKNIRSRRYFYPGCHKMEPYRSMFGDISERLPTTEKLCREVLVLPTGSGVNDDDIEFICQTIREQLSVSK